jgi:hypothetical protein
MPSPFSPARQLIPSPSPIFVLGIPSIVSTIFVPEPLSITIGIDQRLKAKAGFH